ncbi:MAG: hypothetical protein FWF52_02460 [Candidatus Azobacteroides sp.]|nr:hypothetical protein [Candidatus Azobacteroides sp.]
MYLFAFGKDKTFFYDKETSAIYAFLCENYWGDNLTLKIKLLVNLLYCDSFVHSGKIKKELVKKSKELSKYLNRHPEQDLPA